MYLPSHFAQQEPAAIAELTPATAMAGAAS